MTAWLSTVLDMDPTVQAAWVAVTGTLVGSISGAGIQAWFSNRALRAAHDDAEDQRTEMRRALDMQLSEERFARLWEERRGLYARMLESADEWRRANLDLAGVDLASTELGDTKLNKMTMEDARQASPEVAHALNCMYAFGRVIQEVHLLGDGEVRSAVENARSVLHGDMRRAAIDSNAESEGLPEALNVVMQAMRHELIHGVAQG
ncbi:MAG: hypothetical protein JWQ67_781 [Marmoricola sp.]|jgi:hypothetical protein|nr:hypothetical protein [Marmoricola sp.]